MLVLSNLRQAQSTKTPCYSLVCTLLPAPAPAGRDGGPGNLQAAPTFMSSSCYPSAKGTEWTVLES